jgi:hypothetical protein
VGLPNQFGTSSAGCVCLVTKKVDSKNLHAPCAGIGDTKIAASALRPRDRSDFIGLACFTNVTHVTASGFI